MRRLSLVAVFVACFCEAGLSGCASDDAGRAAPVKVTSCTPASLDGTRFAEERRACMFSAGATVEETLGIDRTAASSIPITHVIVRMQENRSYDHYLGQLPLRGQPEAEAVPEGFTNPDLSGAEVRPFPLASTCLEADPPHQWDANRAQWNEGALDGFVRTAAVDGSDGHYVMGYYDEPDLPFLYWAARTFALGDRYFAASLGGTWSNRNFLYTGSAHGVKNTFDRVISDARTVFDQLDEAGVAWGVYTDGWLQPRQDTLGWTGDTPGVYPFSTLIERLRDGTLEPVVFVDTAPGSPNDEHPPYDVQTSDRWTRLMYEEARRSPLWPSLALFLNFDNGGGMFDHVPPPEACVPAVGEEDFDQYGMRVPFIVISPWAKRAHVSHDVNSHTSVLRFIQLLHDLPALTDRDANADALLSMFEFACPPPFSESPTPPPGGSGGCPR